MEEGTRALGLPWPRGEQRHGLHALSTARHALQTAAPSTRSEPTTPTAMALHSAPAAHAANRRLRCEERRCEHAGRRRAVRFARRKLHVAHDGSHGAGHRGGGGAGVRGRHGGVAAAGRHGPRPYRRTRRYGRGKQSSLGPGTYY